MLTLIRSLILEKLSLYIVRVGHAFWMIKHHSYGKLKVTRRVFNMLLILTPGSMEKVAGTMEPSVKIAIGVKTVIHNPLLRTSTRQSFVVIQIGGCQREAS